ncbi:MAG: ATP-binding protein [Acidimicrobiales bacterium]
MMALDDSPVARHLPWGDLAVVPAAAIYGPNASGKSNVLSALAFMRDAVLSSYRLWDPDGGVPTEPFALGTAADSSESTYEVDIAFDGVRYQYGFCVNRAAVTQEWLYAYPGKRRQLWFERDATATEPFAFGRMLAGEKHSIAQLTRPNSLFLSAAAQNNQQQLQPVHRWFSRQLHVLPDLSNPSAGQDRELLERLLAPGASGRVFDLLRFADLGIEGAHVTEDDPSEASARTRRSNALAPPAEGARPRQLHLLHAAEAGNVPLPWTAESQGTRVWARMIGPVLDALDTGRLLTADELDASLHPMLVSELLRMFQDPSINMRGAQLLCTTHDTTLLSPRLDWRLRRDQVWLTEKDEHGATDLYPLSDYKVRTEDNYERGYLLGRYGAIPFLDPSLLEAAADGP